MITSLLRALGVDHTIWIQLGCFIVSYLALTELVFKPYLRAFHERERLTIGNEESAVRIIEEARNLENEYERKARSLNGEVRGVYDSHRTEALEEYDRVVQAARSKAEGLLTLARQKITAETQAARKSLSAEIPAVSLAIASRLAGKDLSL